MLSIFVMRHGPAEPGGNIDDAARQLTVEGRVVVQAAAYGLARTGLAFDTIVASPFTRTRQTAAIMAQTLAPSVAVVTHDALACGAQCDRVAQLIKDNATAQQRVLVVGHMPDVSGFCTFLQTGQVAPGFCFEPSGMALIEFYRSLKPGAGMLRWFMQPGQLASLAKML